MNDGVAELLRDLHGAQRLAVALRVGRAELARDPLFERAAFEVGDHHHRAAMEPGHAAGHRRVVAEAAVAVNLAEVSEECFDEVHRIGAIGMPRELCPAPGLRHGRCVLFCHLDHCSGLRAVRLLIAGVWLRGNGLPS